LLKEDSVAYGLHTKRFTQKDLQLAEEKYHKERDSVAIRDYELLQKGEYLAFADGRLSYVLEEGFLQRKMFNARLVLKMFYS
jgi:hypothetical protein